MQKTPKKKVTVTAKDVQILKKLTNANNHNEALIYVCNLFGYNYYKKQLEHLLLKSYLTLADSGKRYKIYSRIMDKIRKEQGETTYKKIYNCL